MKISLLHESIPVACILPACWPAGGSPSRHPHFHGTPFYVTVPSWNTLFTSVPLMTPLSWNPPSWHPIFTESPFMEPPFMELLLHGTPCIISIYHLSQFFIQPPYTHPPPPPVDRHTPSVQKLFHGLVVYNFYPISLDQDIEIDSNQLTHITKLGSGGCGEILGWNWASELSIHPHIW